MNSMLPSLYRSNQGILRQKLHLIHLLKSKFGETEAKRLYQAPCKIVKASIGQHVRHSADHIERAVNVATEASMSEIHYDLRRRGGLDEHDIDAATTRLSSIMDTFANLASSMSHVSLLDHHVNAFFMLSGDHDLEFPLPSTVARELGFAAHHAIHHLAMIRIIAINTAGLSESDLPHDFGRAPSTVNFDERSNSSGK